MKSLRALDCESRQRAYIKGRIEEQQAWYSRGSASNGKRATAWRWALVCLEVTGFAVALLHFAGVIGLPSEGLVATAIGASGTWLEARQHETLSRAYAVAAQELASIRSRLDRQFTEDEWAVAVSDAEEAISREHTMWRASRSRGS